MNITAEQFLEQYGDVKVKFSSYFKYTFTFVGKTKDKTTITLFVGGNSDSIYREHVVANKEYTVRELEFSYASAEQNSKPPVHCYNSW